MFAAQSHLSHHLSLPPSLYNNAHSTQSLLIISLSLQFLVVVRPPDSLRRRRLITTDRWRCRQVAARRPAPTTPSCCSEWEWGWTTWGRASAWTISRSTSCHRSRQTSPPPTLLPIAPPPMRPSTISPPGVASAREVSQISRRFIGVNCLNYTHNWPVRCEFFFSYWEVMKLILPLFPKKSTVRKTETSKNTFSSTNFKLLFTNW